MASRSYRYDTKIENYNTEISPNEVKTMLERLQAGKVGPANDGKEKDK
jgi:hypothetical protein